MKIAMIQQRVYPRLNRDEGTSRFKIKNEGLDIGRFRHLERVQYAGHQNGYLQYRVVLCQDGTRTPGVLSFDETDAPASWGEFEAEFDPD